MLLAAQPVSASVHPTVAAASADTHKTVVLPRYTASGNLKQSITIDITGPSTLLGGSEHLKLHGQLTKVMLWYTKAMPSYGYRQTSDDLSDNLLSFVSNSNPNLSVSIHFEQPSYQSDIVDAEYDVAWLVPPPRPKSSYVPADSKRVLIRYAAASHGKSLPWKTLTLTNKTKISALVRAINALSIDVRGHVDEHSDMTGGATLQFIYGANKSMDVTVDFQDNQVKLDHVSLFDIQNSVWQLVSKDMGSPAYPAK